MEIMTLIYRSREINDSKNPVKNRVKGVANNEVLIAIKLLAFLSNTERSESTYLYSILIILTNYKMRIQIPCF